MSMTMTRRMVQRTVCEDKQQAGIDAMITILEQLIYQVGDLWPNVKSNSCQYKLPFINLEQTHKAHHASCTKHNQLLSSAYNKCFAFSFYDHCPHSLHWVPAYIYIIINNHSHSTTIAIIAIGLTLKSGVVLRSLIS